MSGDDAFRQALRDAQAQGNFAEIARLHHTAGDEALQRQDSEKAAYHFVRALAAYSQLQDARGVGAMHVRLGNIALQRQQPHIATRHFRRALFAYEEAGHEKGLVGVYVGLGHVAAMQNRTDDARAYYDRALAILLKDLPETHTAVQTVRQYRDNLPA